MTDDQVSDLKLFMTTVIRSEVNAALDEKLDEKLTPIHQKIDDLTAFVQDAVTTSNDANQEQLDDHEVRITRLEKATA
jgi:Na+/phosphate symporter